MKIQYNEIKYGERLILNEGSLVLSCGELTVVSGESGSGKSSLMNQLFNHKELLTIGLSGCLQEPLFMDSLSVSEHIKMLEGLYDTKINEEWIRNLDLENLLNQYPSSLSGGEKKRVGFVLCLLKDASVYMFDEPTASLNDEYTERMIGILQSVMESGKAILVFTHDSKLLKVADNVYHIEQQLLTENKRKEQPVAEHTNNSQKKMNMTKMSFYLSKANHHQKFFTKCLYGLLSLMIALVGAGSSYSEKVYRLQQLALNQIHSGELVFFYSASTDQSANAYTYWTCEAPIDAEKIEEVKEIQGVKDVEWRFDLMEPISPVMYDITSDEYDPYADPRYYVLTINNGTSQSNLELGNCIVSSYMKEHIDYSNIKTDFQQDGIFISSSIADEICRNNSLEEDDLKNVTIQFDLAFPIYTSYGRALTTAEDGSITKKSYLATLDHQIETMPIAGVLKGTAFGINTQSQDKGSNYSLYYDRSIIEELINQNKKTDTRTLYTIDETNFGEYYLNEVPADNTKPIGRIIEEQPWIPNAYSLWLDGLEYYASVKQQLKEMGFTVLSDYVETPAVASGIFSIRKAVYAGTITLALGAVVYTIVLLKLKKKETAKENQYLKNIGLTPKEISKVRKEYHTNNLASGILWILAAYCIVTVIASVLQGFIFTPMVSTFVIFVLLDLICYKIVPDMIEH